jgi:thiamine pyrophosphate-dependent acetolactate synthase large subunit-like protein
VAIVDLAKQLLSELRRRGVTTVFGVPGRESAFLLFDEVPGLRHITARTEFTAGMMACHLGRLTKAPQVAFCTMGPGATNMVTPVATAMLNRSPMILISAQLESDDRLYNVTHQCVDQRTLFKPVTKWSHELSHPESLRWDLARAFAVALADPQGPVHLSIPVDFLKAQVSVDCDLDSPMHTAASAPTTVDTHALRLVRSVLKGAERPVCIVGDEIARGCDAAAGGFVEAWALPTLAAANVKGMLPDDHPLALGSVSPYMEGILGEPMLERIFGPADVIVCVGVRYVDDILPRMWTRGQDKKVVVLSGTPLSDERQRFEATVESVGPLEQQLMRLSDVAQRSPTVRGGNYQWLRDVYRRREARHRPHKGLDPVAAVGVLNRHMACGAALVVDIGFFRHHAILFAKPVCAGRLFTETALSSFGSGLGAALATKLHEPGSDVFLLAGDGGFHSTSPDLSTAVRYGISVVVIVLNSSSYELIGRYQERGGKGTNRDVVELASVDFVRLAQANGWAGVKANDAEELAKALDMRDRSRPFLVEADCHYDDGDRFHEAY